MAKPSCRQLVEQTAALDADLLATAQFCVSDVDQFAELPEPDKERITQHIAQTLETVRNDFAELEDEEMTSASTDLAFEDGKQTVFLAMGRKLGDVGVYKAVLIENPGPNTVDDIYHGYVLSQAFGGGSHAT